ncbi:AraC family transcriptional regulator [Pseudomonas sp. RIT-To-2]|uniref:AraC family transcriptional regulator n=1 Tax=Pseudomonas sp. RIT-To-2 TaxID=3462541 RepID=UPI002413AB96
MPTLAASCAQVILRLINFVPDPSKSLSDFHLKILEKIQDGSALPIIDASEFTEAVMAETGSADVGLFSYDIFRPSQLDSAFYAIMSSATLGEALKTASHFSVLLSERTPLVVTEDDGAITINFTGVHSLGVSRQYIDCCMSTLMGLVHWLLPWEKPVPSSAYFSYEEPSGTERLQSVFGEKLSFSNNINKICFSAADSVRPLGTSNPILKIFHWDHASEQLAKRRLKLSPAVRNLIHAGLTLGRDVALDRVARDLNLGSRTLQNRLEDEGTGFKALYDDCRRELAGELLKVPNTTVMAIAEKLNFRDSSSFHKACNRWFGCPPGIYRTQIIGANYR